MQHSTPLHADTEIDRHVVGAIPLTADCALREIRPGEWLALGSVHEVTTRHEPPARILVGQGDTSDEALAQIERELALERSRWYRGQSPSRF